MEEMQEMQEIEVWSLSQEDPLEKGMATNSSILAENPMDRGAWQATVCGVTKSQTWLSVHTQTHTHTAVPMPASGTEEQQVLVPPGLPRRPDVAKLHACVELCPLPS